MDHKAILTALCFSAVVTLSVSPLSAACLNPPLTIDVINKFKSNPQALVTPDSDSRTIEAMTRDLAGSDPSLAVDLIAVARGTIPRFQTAIAAGLAQAAIACGNVDQNAAQLIQEAVAGFQDGQFQASFAAVAGDLSTAATAAATAYATASAGSVVVINPNKGTGITTNPGGGGGGAVTALLTTTTAAAVTITDKATTAANPVSPTN